MNVKRYIFKKASANHIPVSGNFELTPRCNFCCEMCYIRMSPEEADAVGTELTTDEWLAIGRQAVDAGMVYLLLTGGEPLIRRDFADIYTGLAEMGVVLSLNTNGTQVTDETVRCLKEHPPEKVNVTLYGASSESYQAVCGNPQGYEQALRGIRLLREAGISVCINTTYTRHNAADMERIVALAREEGIPIRMTSYLFPPVRRAGDTDASCYLTPEEYGRLGAAFDRLSMTEAQMGRRKDLIQRVKALSQEDSPQKEDTMPTEGRAASCMAGRGAFWVTWDGQLLPCGMLPHLAKELKGHTFAEVWDGFDGIMDTQCLPAACSVCPKRVICPVCVAVTQCGKAVPQALCRYTDSYMTSFCTGEND